MKFPWTKSEAEKWQALVKSADKVDNSGKRWEEMTNGVREKAKAAIDKDKKKASKKTGKNGGDIENPPTEEPTESEGARHIKEHMLKSKLDKGGFYNCAGGFGILIKLLRNNEEELGDEKRKAPTLLKCLGIRKKDIITVLSLILSHLQNKKVKESEITHLLEKSKDKNIADVLYYDVLGLKDNDQKEDFLPKFEKLTEAMAFMEDLIDAKKTMLIADLLKALRLKEAEQLQLLKEHLSDFTPPTPNEEDEGPDGWDGENLDSTLLAKAMEVPENPIDLKMDEINERVKNFGNKDATTTTSNTQQSNALNYTALLKEISPETEEAINKLMGILRRFRKCTDDERFDLMDEIIATKVGQGNALGRRLAQFKEDVTEENLLKLLANIFKINNNAELAQRALEVHLAFKRKHITGIL